jgi:nitroreductase
VDAIKTILSRRSIRAYTDEPVSPEDMHLLLEAAMSAPSASNNRPFHFIAVRNKETLHRVRDFHPYARMLDQAAAAIFICAKPAEGSVPGYFQQDCAAAAQNVLLAAHALGLGAVWLGVYPREERVAGVRTLMNLPDDVIPFCIISIGYPNEEKEEISRYEEWRVHEETW